MPARIRPNYPEQFKLDAVQLLEHSDRTIRDVAMDIGVSEGALRDWYKRAMAKKGKKPRVVPVVPMKDPPPEEKLARLERENEELRKKVAKLETDREILKKAAAFFAKESE